MITIEILLDKGYDTYMSSVITNQSYVESYQKAIRDEEGKRKYFINIDLYDFSEWRPELDKSFSAKVQYNTHSDEKPVFDVSYYIVKETTIEELETFYEEIWLTQNCDYYDD